MQRIQHPRNREMLQTNLISKNNHLVTGRTPDFLGSVSPKDYTGQADCRRQVRDARIMPDKSDAQSQNAGKIGQRQTLSHAHALRGQCRRQSLQSTTLGLSADQEYINRRGGYEVFQQISPALFRPVLPLTPAAGMQCQSAGDFLLRLHLKPGNRIGIEDREPFERFQIHPRRVNSRLFIRAVGAANELSAGAQPDIGLKYPVRVIQVRHDHIKLRKIIRQILGEFATTGKKTGQRARFD